MKIREMLRQDKVTLSFEVFPPKSEANFQSVYQAAMDVAALQPSYMSVTYGAGGSTRSNTVTIAKDIQEKAGVEAIAHLTCVGARREDIRATLAELEAAGIQNILALRGDRPKDFEGEPFKDYHYASELVEEIKAFGDFCVGGACYPEGHVDAVNKKSDISNLKKKVDAGCEYLTTQMFFDNNIYYNFLYRIREAGITVPVIPGIMPITRATQVKTACTLSGTNMPERFRNLVDHFGENPKAMQQAGIAYATDQIIDLIANGVRHIHVYSMNKPEVAAGIQRNLSEILK
ncbi:MAG: methylenetetrahydrofolate reductase [Lachnospiraceae bacterium]|nr:methylenetetrahydrofolate reductase [NAD(P)H] [Lachnospiraceae bacterium]MBR3761355.1 methylenetetrahydrofolate reductase [NAD(P)H] [Lachnospiraceae bacterium]